MKEYELTRKAMTTIASSLGLICYELFKPDCFSTYMEFQFVDQYGYTVDTVTVNIFDMYNFGLNICDSIYNKLHTAIRKEKTI